MPWQKVTRHISDSRLEVESKNGRRYPVETTREYQNQSAYRMLHNIADTGGDRVLWAWVSFEGESPTVEDLLVKSEFPGAPPWERGK